MSFPTWFWDFDQDGWEDLLVLSYDIRNSGALGIGRGGAHCHTQGNGAVDATAALALVELPVPRRIARYNRIRHTHL